MFRNKSFLIICTQPHLASTRTVFRDSNESVLCFNYEKRKARQRRRDRKKRKRENVAADRITLEHCVCLRINNETQGNI